MHASKPIRRICMLTVTLALVHSVGAQEFPTRTLKLVVPSNSGNSPDHVARIMADSMGPLLGQTIIVENKPSADGIIAYESIAKAGPDGYTMGVVTVPALAGLPGTVKGLRFDPIKDMPPLTTLVAAQYVFGSSSKMPWKDFKEMISSGKYNFGSSGANLRLLVEAIIQDQDLNIVHIPYNGGGPYVTAVITGEVQMGYISASTVTTHGERFRSLATTARSREALRPTVPTFVELGYPQIRGPSFSLNV